MIFAKLKLYALMVGAGLLAFGAFLWRYRNLILKNVEAKETKRRLGAMKQEKEIRHEKENSTDDELISGIMRKR